MATPNNFISYIEKFFGESCSPDLIDKVRYCDSKKLEELSIFYNTTYENEMRGAEFSISPKFLTPYIPATFSNQANWVTKGIDLVSTDFDDIENVWKGIDNIKLRLLYCSSLAIDDPGDFVLDLMGSYVRNGSIGLIRNRFMNYLSFITNIKPLIDQGTLILVPKQVARNCKANSFELTSDFKEKKFDFSDYQKAYEDNTGNRYSSELIDNLSLKKSEENIIMMEKISKRYAGNLDFYLPYNYWKQILEFRFEVAKQEMNERNIESFYLKSLIQSEIPNIQKISIKDIISIRQNEEAFGKWRNDLEKALSKIELHNLKKHQALKNLKIETFEARKKLETELQKSNFMKSASMGVKDFAVGAFGAIPIAFSDEDLQTALLTAGFSSLASMLVRNRMSNKKNNLALMNHYLTIN